jgi:ABC-type antimicrobial peptide transport system permease subunit
MYSVLSYAVARRRREIGVRMALGARPRNVVAMVVRQGIPPVVVGGALGLAGAVFGSRSLAAALYDTSTTDVRIYSMVGIAIVVTGLAASFIPGLHASRLDAMEAIRAD